MYYISHSEVMTENQKQGHTRLVGRAGNIPYRFQQISSALPYINQRGQLCPHITTYPQSFWQLPTSLKNDSILKMSPEEILSIRTCVLSEKQHDLQWLQGQGPRPDSSR